jgi:hypothetical protein
LRKRSDVKNWIVIKIYGLIGIILSFFVVESFSLIYELFNEKILRIFFLKNGKTEKKI